MWSEIGCYFKETQAIIARYSCFALFKQVSPLKLWTGHLCGQDTSGPEVLVHTIFSLTPLANTWALHQCNTRPNAFHCNKRVRFESGNTKYHCLARTTSRQPCGPVLSTGHFPMHSATTMNHCLAWIVHSMAPWTTAQSSSFVFHESSRTHTKCYASAERRSGRDSAQSESTRWRREC